MLIILTTFLALSCYVPSVLYQYMLFKQDWVSAV